MKTKRQVTNLAKNLNVVMTESTGSGYYDVTFWSDDNRVFNASNATCLVISWFSDDNKGEFWQECYNELSSGLDECD